MSQEFKVTLPKLGESIVSATVVKWFKKVGDLVKLDEGLLEVSTDKVNSEIPSPVAGRVKEILVLEDREVEVGTPLAVLELNGEYTPVVAGSTEKESTQETVSTGSCKSQFYSPALMRLAREHQISLDELGKIRGTGVEGRITKKDLEDHLAARSNVKPCASVSKSSSVSADVEHIKMTGMRKAIAENMVKSFYAAPHASLVTEVDLTHVTKLIQKEKEAFLARHGYKLTVTSFVIRAMTRALEEFPLLNSSLDGETIVLKRFVNVGIAVSVEHGLVVPVIKNCHRLSLAEIAKAVADLSYKARTSTLTVDDVKEGTVTLSNFGISGVAIGIPIIRHPEVAIIGIGAIQKKVVAHDDNSFGIRDLMHVSLTFDHRVVDGMYGCGFLNAVKMHLEKDGELA